jgi:hypothetical protein
VLISFETDEVPDLFLRTESLSVLHDVEVVLERVANDYSVFKDGMRHLFGFLERYCTFFWQQVTWCDSTDPCSIIGDVSFRDHKFVHQYVAVIVHN